MTCYHWAFPLHASPKIKQKYKVFSRLSYLEIEQVHLHYVWMTLSDYMVVRAGKGAVVPVQTHRHSHDLCLVMGHPSGINFKTK